MDMNKEGNKNHMNRKDLRKNNIKSMAERLQLLSVTTIYKTSMRTGSSSNIIEKRKQEETCSFLSKAKMTIRISMLYQHPKDNKIKDQTKTLDSSTSFQLSLSLIRSRDHSVLIALCILFGNTPFSSTSVHFKNLKSSMSNCIETSYQTN